MSSNSERIRITLHETLTINEVARHTGIRVETISEFISLGLVDPLETGEPEPLFSNSAVARINKIERLRTDLGVGLAAMGLVLDLLDRIDELEHELRLYRRG